MDPMIAAIRAALEAVASTAAPRTADEADSDTWHVPQEKSPRSAGSSANRVDPVDAPKLDPKAETRKAPQARQVENLDTELARAIAEARRQFEESFKPEVAMPLLKLLETQPELLRVAIEEYLFRRRPNVGRLADLYRRETRPEAQLAGKKLPSWPEVAPSIRIFMENFVSEALREAEIPLLSSGGEPDRSETSNSKRIGCESRTKVRLKRIEALLEEMSQEPKWVQRVEGESVSHVTQIQCLGHAIPELDRSDVETLFDRYRRFTRGQYELLDFRGILQAKNFVKLRLGDIYVSLRGSRAGSDDALLLSAWKGKTGPPRVGKGGPISNPATVLPTRGFPESLHADAARSNLVDDFVRDNPLLVVLGGPGTGKSTMVRVLMLMLTEGRAGESLGLDAEWLPILFPVAAFAVARQSAGNEDLAPFDYLLSHLEGLSQPNYRALFLRALSAGRAVVLIDGIDEVREDRLGIVRCLEAFIREWDFLGNRFVATSRIAGYEDAPLDDRLFTRVELAPFSDDDIRLFIEKWSLAYERAGREDELDEQGQSDLEQRAKRRTASLIQAVFAEPGVTDLARIPLLLTILGLIHDQGTQLPDRRVDLYQRCVEALAESWNRARSLSGREIDAYLGGEKLDESFVVNLLGPAALWIHDENPGGVVEERDLEQKLADVLVKTDELALGKARRLSADFVQLVRSHTGLLEERGQKKYGFLHLSFEEYLAARALLESVFVEDPDVLIHLRAVEPRWSEVLRLTLASASQREAERLLLHLLKAPATEQTRGRPVVLAGECLLDIGRNRCTKKAWNEVVQHLVRLLEDTCSSFQVRIDGARVLGRVGDPRVLDPVRGDNALGSYWCRMDPGPFWSGDDRRTGRGLQVEEIHFPYQIGRIPVTNVEFDRFVDDGGYREKRWWRKDAWDRIGKKGIGRRELREDLKYNGPTQPVIGVTWWEAAAFCAWCSNVGHRAGWLKKSEVIRLPSWLEWERAARHTDRRRYPWRSGPDTDSEPSPERANYLVTGVGAPSPVGCFPAGAAECGALDMAGNVLEWTSTPTSDPDAGAMVVDSPDVRFGGSMLVSFSYYGDPPSELCCGARGGNLSINWYYNLGFRLVWSVGF